MRTGLKFSPTTQGNRRHSAYPAFWKGALNTFHIIKAAQRGSEVALQVQVWAAAPLSQHIQSVGGRREGQEHRPGQPVLTQCPSPNTGIQLITSSCDSLVNV